MSGSHACGNDETIKCKLCPSAEVDRATGQVQAEGLVAKSPLHIKLRVAPQGKLFRADVTGEQALRKRGPGLGLMLFVSNYHHLAAEPLFAEPLGSRQGCQTRTDDDNSFHRGVHEPSPVSVIACIGHKRAAC